MIDFTGKTYQSILAGMLQRIPGTYDKRDTSPIPTALGPAAWALEGFYLALNIVQGQAFVQTATGESLDMLAPIGGISRDQASAAVRLGVFNMAVPIGARFSTVNGEDSINFTVTAATGTEYQFQLTAETPGSVGNDYTGPILPITTIPGLTSAQITEILVPGEDTETDDSLRARLIAALNERPFGGNIAAYREAVLDIEGVGAVQVWPTWNGGGTVKLSVVEAGDFLPASSVLLEAVQNAIDPPPNQGLGLGMAPIGATVTTVAPEVVAVDVSATLTLAAGYTLEQVRPLVQTALEGLFLSVREGWGTALSTSEVLYGADVYLARVSAAILGVTGILNVTDLTLNGAAADVILTQSGTVQQVPALGTVTLA